MSKDQCKGSLALGTGCMACSGCFGQQEKLYSVAVHALVKAGYGLVGDNWVPIGRATPVDQYSNVDSRRVLATSRGMYYRQHDACDSLSATSDQMADVLRELLAIEISPVDTAEPVHFHLQPGHTVERAASGAMRILADDTIAAMVDSIRDGGEIAKALEVKYGLIPFSVEPLPHVETLDGDHFLNLPPHLAGVEAAQKIAKHENGVLQSMCTVGSPEWHVHETIDDHLFEIASRVEQIIDVVQGKP